MINQIALGSNTVSCVSTPGGSDCFESVTFNVSDAVAIVTSPFTGQTQAQQWNGADMLSGTATLPSLTQDKADEWISFLMECRGMANAFQLGDPMKRHPRGCASGSPVVDGGFPNAAGTQFVFSKNWPVNVFGLLLPGDYIQIGFRLHRVIDRVNSDAAGNAVISIWPSLREIPADNEPIVLNNPVGLFRLGSNKRTWSSDVTSLTKLSFPIIEYR